jgi:hypothetical protein
MLMVEVDPAFHVDPSLASPRHKEIVGIGHDFGQQVGSLHEPLADFVLGIDDADIGLGLVIAA